MEDGLAFDADGLVVEAIRDDQLYGGLRVRTRAFLGKTRIPIQVDIGFGDAVTPGVEEIEFPPLLRSEGLRLKAYPRGTVIAEKFQAIVALGVANIRMKDFYDLLGLTRLFSFDGRTVAAAIRATFDRRGTPVPSRRPTGLGAAFSSDPQKVAQWNAFTARELLLIQAKSPSAAVEEIASFIMPSVRAVYANDDFITKWNPSARVPTAAVHAYSSLGAVHSIMSRHDLPRPVSAVQLEELPLRQAPERSVARHQLVVGAGLDDPPFFEHQDAVSVAHRAEAVGDDDARGIHRREALAHDRLGPVVERAGCLVEEDQPRLKPASDIDTAVVDSLKALAPIGRLAKRCSF